jgi:membrane fusion protein (multidrug efflux system)
MGALPESIEVETPSVEVAPDGDLAPELAVEVAEDEPKTAPEITFPLRPEPIKPEPAPLPEPMALRTSVDQSSPASPSAMAVSGSPSGQLAPAASARDSRPFNSTDRVAARETPPKKSSAASMVGLVVVLVAVAGVVGYVRFLGPSGANVTVRLASTREFVRLYDGAATVSKSEGHALSFGESGKLVDVIAQGTEVKAGMPLGTLEAFGKVEKELTDVKDRASFYDKQLQAAKATGKEEEARKAEVKVAEKRKLLGELEERAGKLRLVAQASGTVSQVHAAAGEEIKAGQPVIQIGDQRLAAIFKLSAEDASGFKAGASVSLQRAAGGPAASGRVAKVDGPSVTVEIVDDHGAGAIKDGESLRLVRGKVPNVVPIPPSALVKVDGADTVFVLTGGEAKARRVTVVDRTPSEVLIGNGLAAGESVITSGGESLHDGQKATATP